MTATPDLAGRYLAAWNETDPAARAAAIEDLFTDDVTYTDPLVSVQGRQALDATIAAVQQQFPGFVFQAAGPADAHHDQVRFTWDLGQPGRDAPVSGFDVAVVDGTGRIRTVLGFLDRVPAAA
ncbi:nuclear transport factor 2 family protein [Blastococcus haudaquaticus]|uniref:SnoaL-like domain-containing protein n=1 Tax=Blastococcus haudaquaticus TaxID=1938745 RepID=A0A286H7V8_9ACTN|nr:nuclear transport factor 2 family protein [Blastococcus haudaquaticus]SOE03858.1 SnoaL-like domain-containing protein [Blastococcus haudaquaticus]